MVGQGRQPVDKALAREAIAALRGARVMQLPDGSYDLILPTADDPAPAGVALTPRARRTLARAQSRGLGLDESLELALGRSSRERGGRSAAEETERW